MARKNKEKSNSPLQKMQREKKEPRGRPFPKGHSFGVKPGQTIAKLKPMTESQVIAKMAMEELQRVSGINRKNSWPKRRVTMQLHKQLDNIVELSSGAIVTGEEALAKRLMELALAGDRSAINDIIDRVEGRPNQSMEVTNRGTIGVVSATTTLREAASLYAQHVRSDDDEDEEMKTTVAEKANS